MNEAKLSNAAHEVLYRMMVHAIEFVPVETNPQYEQLREELLSGIKVTIGIINNFYNDRGIRSFTRSDEWMTSQQPGAQADGQTSQVH